MYIYCKKSETLVVGCKNRIPAKIVYLAPLIR